MPNDVDISREIKFVSDVFVELNTTLNKNNEELRNVQKNLRLNPTNTELLAEKQELLGNQLENAQKRAEELTAQLQVLNDIEANGAELDIQQIARRENLNRLLSETNREITALTGATKDHVETLETAEIRTESFSKSMTEFQSNLRAVNQVMRGVNTTFKMFGGDTNSTMGLMIKQGQQTIQMMTGIMSAGKLLAKQNETLGKSFMAVGMAAGAAAATYQFGSMALNALDDDTRAIVAPLMIVVGALIAVAAAAAAAVGYLSWGTALVAIGIGVGASIAALQAMIPKTPEDALYPTSSYSSPSIPSTSAGTGTTQKQMTANITINFENNAPMTDSSAKNISSQIANEVNKQLGVLISG